MDAARGDEEHVALAHLIACQGIAYGVILHHMLILLGGNLFFQSVVEMCALVRLQDIPHLGLAMLFSQFVCCLFIGMHLNRQVALGVDELDEQRELIAEAAVIVGSQKALALLAHQLVERLALVLALAHHGLAARHAREFPTLAYLGL